MAALLANSVRRRIALGSDAGRGIMRLGDQIDADRLDAFQIPRCAMVSGFSVHANVWVEARDRQRSERLCRYAARPAIASERLSRLPDGRLLYQLKRPWRDGTRAVIFEPQDFMAKLAVLVPAPRAHLTRYHGALGPAAAWRPLIIPAAAANNENTKEIAPGAAPHEPSTMPDVDFEPTPDRPPFAHHRNYTWAELMKRVFLVDALQCQRCGGGRMKILAAIYPPDATQQILECLGLPSRAPPLAPAVSDFNPQVDSF